MLRFSKLYKSSCSWNPLYPSQCGGPAGILSPISETWALSLNPPFWSISYEFHICNVLFIIRQIWSCHHHWPGLWPHAEHPQRSPHQGPQSLLKAILFTYPNDLISSYSPLLQSVFLSKRMPVVSKMCPSRTPPGPLHMLLLLLEFYFLSADLFLHMLHNLVLCVLSTRSLSGAPV